MVLFIGLWPHLSSSFEYKKEIINALYSDNTKALSFQANAFFNMTENFIMRLSSILLYTFKGLQLLYQYRKNEYRYVLLPPQQKKTTLRWLLLLHCIILCTVLSYGLFVIKITLSPDVFNSALNGTIIYGSAFFLGLLVFSLLAFPDILYGFPRRERTKASEQSVSAKQIKNNTFERDAAEREAYLSLVQASALDSGLLYDPNNEDVSNRLNVDHLFELPEGMIGEEFLFNLKLRIFDMHEVMNCEVNEENSKLKTKLRLK